MNKFFATGNLVKDPVFLRPTPESCLTKVTFGVLRNKGETKTTYLTLEFWGEAKAKFIDNYAKKGDKMLVEGKLVTASYKKEGSWRHYVGLNVDRFELLTFRPPKNKREVSVFELEENVGEVEEYEYLDALFDDQE